MHHSHQLLCGQYSLVTPLHLLIYRCVNIAHTRALITLTKINGENFSQMKPANFRNVLKFTKKSKEVLQWHWWRSMWKLWRFVAQWFLRVREVKPVANCWHDPLSKMVSTKLRFAENVTLLNWFSKYPGVSKAAVSELLQLIHKLMSLAMAAEVRFLTSFKQAKKMVKPYLTESKSYEICSNECISYTGEYSKVHIAQNVGRNG